ALVAFDAAKLVDDPTHAKIGSVAVGAAPVPLLVFADDRRIIVGNSNRFAADTGSASTLTLLDAEKIADGAPAVLATIPCGGFPRDLQLAPDGHTILLANFLSRTVQVIDARELK